MRDIGLIVNSIIKHKTPPDDIGFTFDLELKQTSATVKHGTFRSRPQSCNAVMA